MDEERRKWRDQYYRYAFGNREIGRQVLFGGSWLIIGTLLYFVFDKIAILFAFVAIYYVFIMLALIWTPAWAIYRQILGNENLPLMPIPLSWRALTAPFPKLKWWQWLLAILMFSIGALPAYLLAYLMIEYLLK